MEQIQNDVIFSIGSIGKRRSSEIGNHVKHVAEYTKVLSSLYGLAEEETEMLKHATPMQDIGKVAIPDSILNKPTQLSPEERVIIQTDTTLGYEMFKSSSTPLLKAAAIVAHEHHEIWDGMGYPNQKKEKEIHIYGHIVAIVDVFDALGSERCYKKAWKGQEIFEFFRKERAKQFDPELLDLFFLNINQFLSIRDMYQDTE